VITLHQAHFEKCQAQEHEYQNIPRVEIHKVCLHPNTVVTIVIVKFRVTPSNGFNVFFRSFLFFLKLLIILKAVHGFELIFLLVTQFCFSGVDRCDRNEFPLGNLQPRSQRSLVSLLRRQIAATPALQGTLTLPERPFLVTYGLVDNNDQSFHGTIDYRASGEAASSNFHDHVIHQISDDNSVFGRFTPPDKLITACPLYDPTATNSNPASRAGDFK
jgi:hypothetical protein